MATRRIEKDHLKWGGLKPGTKLGELGPIFPRADPDAIKKMRETGRKRLIPKASAGDRRNGRSTLQPRQARCNPTTTTAPLPTTTPTTDGEVRRSAQPVTDCCSCRTAGTPQRRRAQTPRDHGHRAASPRSNCTSPRSPRSPNASPRPTNSSASRWDLGFAERRQILFLASPNTTPPESLIGREVDHVDDLAPRESRTRVQRNAPGRFAG